MRDKGEWPTSPIVGLGSYDWHDVLEALQDSALTLSDKNSAYSGPRWPARMNLIYNNIEAQLKRNPYYHYF